MENFLTEPDAQLFGTEATPSESSPEKEEKAEQVTEPEEAKPASQGEGEDGEAPDDLSQKAIPYKRFKEVNDAKARLQERELELLNELAEARKPKQETPTHQEGKPEWFKKVFGDDDEVWSGFQNMTASAKESAKREALQEIEAKQTEAQETQKRANDWVEEQVSSLKESDGDFDRNALFKVMDKYKPTNSEGNLDFKAGLEILRLQTPADAKEKSAARRKLADKLNTTSGKTEPSGRDYKTRADLQKMGGWDSVYEN